LPPAPPCPAFGHRCALRAGWPWRLPARAPTEPYVLILEHTVLQPTDSPSPKGPRSCSPAYRGHADEPRCVQHVWLGRAGRPTLRFPHRGPPGRVPLLHRYYQSATTSCRPSRRTSLPVLGRTRLVFSLFWGMPVSLSAHSKRYSLEHVQEICSTVRFDLLC